LLIFTSVCNTLFIEEVIAFIFLLKGAETMKKENLKKIDDILNSMLYKKEYNQDKEVIEDLKNKINDLLLNEEKVTVGTLDTISNNIKYLDIKYDNLYELVNLFDPVEIEYREMIHKKYVENLRKLNRRKKESE